MTSPTSASASASDGGGGISDTRDSRALARFDLFLFTAVATVLVVRTALAATGYPQVGGGGLHVAHVLWGGLLMGASIVLVQILPGGRVRVRAAFIGGIGFGLFIDEVGKFLTKDVNYFFKPAIAIIYAVFMGTYLIVREVLQRRRLTDARRLALAAGALTDLALGQLDSTARDHALALLDGVDDTSGHAQAAAAVRAGLLAQPPEPPGVEARLTRAREWIAGPTRRLLLGDRAVPLLGALFAIEAADVVMTLVLTLAHPGGASSERTLLDTVLPSVLSALLLVAGFLRLVAGARDQHEQAVRLLRWAVLIELLFTQVVFFNREQWLGLAGFAGDLVVLWLLGLARSGHQHADA